MLHMDPENMFLSNSNKTSGLIRCNKHILEQMGQKHNQAAMTSSYTECLNHAVHDALLSPKYTTGKYYFTESYSTRLNQTAQAVF